MVVGPLNHVKGINAIDMTVMNSGATCITGFVAKVASSYNWLPCIEKRIMNETFQTGVKKLQLSIQKICMWNTKALVVVVIATKSHYYP